jgi:hypothetical protein
MRFSPALICLALSLSLLAVEPATAQKADAPAALVRTPYLILDTVVIEQWPATLALINPPTNIALLNPGQCIRVAALANGAGHEHFFDGASLAFNVSFAGQPESMPSAPIAAIKQIKPEGMDFVTGALNAAGIKNPIPSFVTMAASAGSWCAPVNASDGAAEVTAVVTRNGNSSSLKPVKVVIESLATAEKKSFKDVNAFGEFSQTYHIHPEPGRLLTALQTMLSFNLSSPIPLAFFSAAFQHDAPTVRLFGPEVGRLPKAAQTLALSLLASAHVTLADPPKLPPDEEAAISQSEGLPDPYQLKPDEQLPTMLDFLWSEFCATGRRKPIDAVVSGLAWQLDFAAFDKMKQSGKKPTALTPSLMRGVSYMAAGWSLRSFEHNDQLATDYLEAIAADPTISPQIKAELSKLDTNPAFNRQ